MNYELIMALHIISVISFMAGIMYLPRLFAYHVTVPVGSDQDKLFQVMEKRLLRIIINPALIAVWGFGIWMITIDPSLLHAHWFHAKATLVLILTGFHGICSRWRKQLAAGHYVHSNKFFRAVNEIPAVLMILIVLLVVLKPF